jgi:hypothetical protein
MQQHYLDRSVHLKQLWTALAAVRAKFTSREEIYTHTFQSLNAFVLSLRTRYVNPEDSRFRVYQIRIDGECDGRFMQVYYTRLDGVDMFFYVVESESRFYIGNDDMGMYVDMAKVDDEYDMIGIGPACESMLCAQLQDIVLDFREFLTDPELSCFDQQYLGNRVPLHVVVL